MFLLLILISLGACQGQTLEGEQEVATLTFWTFVAEHADYYEDAAASWNEQYPDQQLKIEAIVMPFDQLYQNLLISLQSGVGAPDLVDVELGQAATQMRGSNPPFEPLNEELEPYLDYLVQSRLDNFEKNGKYYGVDYHVGTMVMFYNTEILEQAGIDYLDIVTWDDYIEAGKIIKERTGAWMTQVETTVGSAFEAMTTQQGVDFTDKEGRANLATDEGIQALQLLQDLVYQHEIARTAVGTNFDNEEFFAEINQGNLASVLGAAWYMNRMVSFMPDLSGKIVITPMPVFNEDNNRSSAFGGTATMVTNQANHKVLAKRFAVWSKADRDQAIKQWTLLGFDPIRWDVWDDESLKSENEYTHYFGSEIFETLLEVKDEIQSVKKSVELTPILIDHLMIAVLPNVISEAHLTAEEALKEADQILNR